MQRTNAERGAFALRILWVVLMVVLGVLIVTSQISGVATILYGVAVLGVMFAEKLLRGKNRQP